MTAPVEKTVMLTPAEQDTKALEAFENILSLSQATEDRKTVLPQMEKIYAEIINKYPDASLAQESYWRLIAIYADDYSPADYTRAENLYYEFIGKYPNSPLKSIAEETLGTSYYKDEKWDKLLSICKPAVQEYFNNKTRPRPALIFMFSEANFNLGNYSEALKGYKIVIDLFPRLNESIKSKARLQVLEKLEKKEIKSD